MKKTITLTPYQCRDIVNAYHCDDSEYENSILKNGYTLEVEIDEPDTDGHEQNMRYFMREMQKEIDKLNQESWGVNGISERLVKIEKRLDAMQVEYHLLTEKIRAQYEVLIMVCKKVGIWMIDKSDYCLEKQGVRK